VQELRGSGRFATDPAALQAALRTVEAELPGGAPATAMPLPPVPAAKPVLPEAETPIGPIKLPPRTAARAADEAAGFAPFDIDFSAPIQYPAAGDADAPGGVAANATTPETTALVPDLELVDFAELGAPLGEGMAPTVTVLEESVDETIDVGLPAELRDAAKPVLRVVADNTAAHVGPTEPRARSTHGPELTLLTEAPVRTAEVTTPLEPEEVTVGSVTLSAALWRILCDEADQNVAVLASPIMMGFPAISAMDFTSLRGWVMRTCGSFWNTAITTLIPAPSRTRLSGMKALEPMPKSAAPPANICGTFTEGPPSMIFTSSPCFL
jgi:hypothetical protein